jgi:hypothetical protein
MVSFTCKPRLKQQDGKFEASLGKCEASLGYIVDCVSKKEKGKKKKKPEEKEMLSWLGV